MADDQNIIRQAYRELTTQEKEDMAEIKDAGLGFWNICEKIGLYGAPGKAPGSRELSLAKTKIEEAVMWAMKHITC